MRLDDELLAIYRAMRRAHAIGNYAVRDDLYRSLRRDHCIELFYEVELPENVMFVHPLGTVLGRAQYADYLAVYQNVGVGSDLDGNRPVFKGPAVLFPGVKVSGAVTIGANVFVTANTTISGTTKRPIVVPDNCVVFMDWRQDYPGSMYSPRSFRPEFKPTRRSVLRDVFKVG